MSDWINVNEWLPSGSECVDVWGEVKGGGEQGLQARIESCFFDVSRDSFWKWNDDFSEKIMIECFDVTHWMPLPEPP